MTNYCVHLADGSEVPILAGKFYCEEGYVVFYARNSEAKFEEVYRVASTNVKSIKEE